MNYDTTIRAVYVIDRVFETLTEKRKEKNLPIPDKKTEYDKACYILYLYQRNRRYSNDYEDVIKHIKDNLDGLREWSKLTTEEKLRYLKLWAKSKCYNILRITRMKNE